MDLTKLIKKEQITLTDKIFRGAEEIRYHISWTMKRRKTKFNTGKIILVDGLYSNQYFKRAFKKKYNIQIPKSEKYDYLIDRKINRSRSICRNMI